MPKESHQTPDQSGLAELLRADAAAREQETKRMEETMRQRRLYDAWGAVRSFIEDDLPPGGDFWSEWAARIVELVAVLKADEFACHLDSLAVNEDPAFRYALEIYRAAVQGDCAHVAAMLCNLDGDGGLTGQTRFRVLDALRRDVMEAVLKTEKGKTRSQNTQNQTGDVSNEVFEETQNGIRQPGSQESINPALWSKPDTPKRWGKLWFNCSSRTFIRRCERGQIKHLKENSKSYRVAFEHLPPDHPDRKPN